MKKTLILVLMALSLSSCSSYETKTNLKIEVVEFESKDLNAFNILVNQFANNIENIWGLKEVLIAGSKDYVKYTDNYLTRSHINFDSGVINIETMETTGTLEHLRKAIILTLLMGDDPNSMDLYSSDDDVEISKEPFLYGQVLDNENQPIRWEWRAARFVDYLLSSKLTSRRSGLHNIWSVQIKLVPNHVDKRAHKYLPYIKKSALKYGIDDKLIVAIMQIESSFNPYAVSRSDALGLMQVVRHTAGRDVFKFQGQLGQPTRSYLFDPEKNIDTGTAYLSILQDNYLAGIRHPIAKRYAVITAYNAGAGSVLRMFSNDKEIAIQMINRLTPDELYQRLTKSHPSGQARRYLLKVNSVYKK